MACYNPDSEEFQSVCRVMSGFSDSFYTEVNQALIHLLNNLFLQVWILETISLLVMLAFGNIRFKCLSYCFDSSDWYSGTLK